MGAAEAVVYDFEAIGGGGGMLTFITSTHMPELSEPKHSTTTQRRCHSIRVSSSGRLLLSDAVNAASPFDDVQCRHLDYFAV